MTTNSKDFETFPEAATLWPGYHVFPGGDPPKRAQGEGGHQPKHGSSSNQGEQRLFFANMMGENSGYCLHQERVGPSDVHPGAQGQEG